MKTLLKFMLLLPFVLLSACGHEDYVNEPNKDSEIKSDLEKSAVKIRASAGDREWTGSGFFIGNDGYIVTNNHIVSGADSTLQIAGFGGFTGTATHVAVAECADLAVIKLEEANAATYSGLDWYQGDLRAGMIIGTGGFAANTQISDHDNSYSYFGGTINTVQQGYSSFMIDADRFIHDAAISSGSSGSPVIELDTGKVVGINYAADPRDNNRKYAISSSVVRKNIEKMITSGEDIFSIGIWSFLDINPATGKSAGVRVISVQSDGKAEAIGMQPGDLIIKVQDTLLDDADNYSLKTYCDILQKNIGDNLDNPLPIEIFRPTRAGGKYCIGEINGDKLTLKEDSSLPCSHQAPEGSKNTISGELDTSDVQSDDGYYVDMYEVTATTSGTAMVSISSDSIDGIISGVFTDSGNLVAFNGEKFDVFTGELFSIIVIGGSNETGTYTIALENLEQ